MDIEACARLELPFDEARRRLLSVRPEIGRRICLSLPGLPVGKEVEVDIDRPFDGDGAVSLPLRWQATWPPVAFPRFRGELELTRMSDGSAELWLLGNYRPPLGALGRTLDRSVLHALAHDSVRELLEHMASRLQYPAHVA